MNVYITISLRTIIRNIFELLRFTAAFNIINIIKGIDYYRVIEYPVVLSILENYLDQDKNNNNLLDIGSLDTPFPLYLADKGFKVFALDINKRVISLETIAKNFNIEYLKSIIANATKLPFNDNIFDGVTAISSIEHILPLKDGDSSAIKEIGRILKPNGIAIITIPFNDNFKEEWRYQSDHGKYLIRRYNTEEIQSRLIKQSGLDLLDLVFFCDDLKFYKIWYKFLFYIFAPISFIFALIFIKIKDKPVNAKGVVIALIKREKVVYDNKNY